MSYQVDTTLLPPTAQVRFATGADASMVSVGDVRPDLTPVPVVLLRSGAEDDPLSEQLIHIDRAELHLRWQYDTTHQAVATTVRYVEHLSYAPDVPPLSLLAGSGAEERLLIRQSVTLSGHYVVSDTLSALAKHVDPHDVVALSRYVTDNEERIGTDVNVYRAMRRYLQLTDPERLASGVS